MRKAIDQNVETGIAGGDRGINGDGDSPLVVLGRGVRAVDYIAKPRIDGLGGKKTFRIVLPLFSAGLAVITQFTKSLILLKAVSTSAGGASQGGVMLPPQVAVNIL